jgi:hypothetical protein
MIRENAGSMAQNGKSLRAGVSELEKFDRKLFQSLCRLDFVAMCPNANSRLLGRVRLQWVTDALPPVEWFPAAVIVEGLSAVERRTRPFKAVTEEVAFPLVRRFVGSLRADRMRVIILRWQGTWDSSSQLAILYKRLTAKESPLK